MIGKSAKRDSSVGGNRPLNISINIRTPTRMARIAWSFVINGSHFALRQLLANLLTLIDRNISARARVSERKTINDPLFGLRHSFCFAHFSRD